MNNFIAEELYNEYQRIVEEQGASSGPGRVRLFEWEIEYTNVSEILAFIDFILFRRMNDFYPDTESPLILDCGANIGYTVLYYKHAFPKAKILAFEPDPDSVPILRRNIERNGLKDVQIINSAVWIEDGEVFWFCEGVDGSRIVQDNTFSDKIVTVPAIDLAKYLVQDIDLLKLDIEEAEFTVIPHIHEQLHRVKNILVEIHLKNQSRYAGLSKIIDVLINSGFKISINSYSPWRDLIRRHIPPTPYHSEQYVLLAGWRSEHPSVSPEPTFLPYHSIVTHEEYRISSRQAEQSARLNEINLLLQDGLISFAQKTGTWKLASLQGKFIHENGLCWISKLPSKVSPGDNLNTFTYSSLLLFEDHRLLGPAHVPHHEIRAQGTGRYSHWLSDLYFSTSDGTDPNVNGRTYTIIWRDEQAS